jgi:transposase-like protein
MARSQAQIRALGESVSARSRGKPTYSEAFKRDAVEKARAAQSLAQVARELGVARNTLSGWMKEAAPPPLTLIEAVKSGNRKAYLEAMRDELAAKIAGGMAARDLPPNVRLLNETMRELDELAAREAEEAADAASAPDEDLDPDDL